MIDPADVAARIERLRRSRPELVELATVVSPAVRVESALLRHLRVTLLPELHPATEADLWFSQLVDRYYATGFELRPDYADALRRRLARNPDQFQWACEIIRSAHAQSAQALRIQERIIHLVFRREPGWQAEIGRALEPVLAALDGPDAQAIAAWAARALPEFPREAHKVATFWQVREMAQGIVGDIPVGADPPPEQFLRMRDRPPNARLRDRGIELDHAARE